MILDIGTLNSKPLAAQHKACVIILIFTNVSFQKAHIVYKEEKKQYVVKMIAHLRLEKI